MQQAITYLLVYSMLVIRLMHVCISLCGAKQIIDQILYIPFYVYAHTTHLTQHTYSPLHMEVISNNTLVIKNRN